MGKQGFKELVVWQKAKDLAVCVLLRTNEGAFSRDFSLKDQVRRAVVSVPSNIAEGDERDTDRESVHFFRIAKGSLAELRTQLEISCDIGYLTREELSEFELRCTEIGRM